MQQQEEEQLLKGEWDLKIQPLLMKNPGWLTSFRAMKMWKSIVSDQVEELQTWSHPVKEKCHKVT